MVESPFLSSMKSESESAEGFKPNLSDTLAFSKADSVEVKSMFFLQSDLDLRED